MVDSAIVLSPDNLNARAHNREQESCVVAHALVPRFTFLAWDHIEQRKESTVLPLSLLRF